MTVKYVALLAFNKIVTTHPHLVSQQDDVILDCIDSPDITIRIQALDLVQGMVTSDNLVLVVSRLMKQLKSSAPSRDVTTSKVVTDSSAESDDDGHAPAETSKSYLPEDYRIDVIGRILFMCSKDNYANIVDFDWYIDILTQLVRIAPFGKLADYSTSITGAKPKRDVAEGIGDELRNIAVKVRAMRATAVRASEIILAQMVLDSSAGHPVSSKALRSVSWILGEYTSQLGAPDDTLNGLLQIIPRLTVPDVSSTSIQAVAKVFSSLAGNDMEPWTPERKSQLSLLMARIIHVLEPLTLDPSLEVQGRAVEFIELLKLTAEAASAHPAATAESDEDPPLLLTQAIPSLFKGWELNSVAPKAQINVPPPDGLDLEEPIHPNLNHLLAQADQLALNINEEDDFEVYYHQRPAPTSISSASAPAIDRLVEPASDSPASYQDLSEDSYLDADIVARRKAERQERNKDDPFYIPTNDNIPRTSTPIHNILQDNNGPDLDIDSIPIMQLDLGKLGTSAPTTKTQPRARQKMVIATDETLEGRVSPRAYDSENNSDSFTKTKARKLKQSLLGVDSSYIGSFNLEGDSATTGYDYERQQREEQEMQQAMKEVERLRLEMQRANERIQVAQGVDAEGTTIVRKKKKKKQEGDGVTSQGDSLEAKPKKKKKKAKAPIEGEDGHAAAPDEAEVAVTKKVKKKKKGPAEIAEVSKP
jgi:AP-3 complex subunit delta